MNNLKEKVLATIRHALTLLGALLVFKFPGIESLWNELAGSAVILAGLIWSFFEKGAGVALSEKVLGLVRHVMGILVVVLTYFGKDGGVDVVNQITSYIAMAIPFIFSFFEKDNRAKVNDMNTRV